MNIFVRHTFPMSKNSIKTKTVLTMTDMTQSTELQAFIRQKIGYKVNVKISLCICVVISWDELKVRQNLLDSDYKIYMVRPLVATVNWHKSLKFVKKVEHNTLTLCIYDFISRFDYYITPWYYFLIGAQVLHCVFPSLIYIIGWSRNNWYRHKWIFTMHKDFCSC